MTEEIPVRHQLGTTLSGGWAAGRSGIGNEGDDAHVRTAISAKQRERLESVLKPNRAWTYWEATNTRPSAAGRRLTACGQERVLAAGASRARTGRKQTLAMGALERGESEHKAVVALRESQRRGIDPSGITSTDATLARHTAPRGNSCRAVSFPETPMSPAERSPLKELEALFAELVAGYLQSRSNRNCKRPRFCILYPVPAKGLTNVTALVSDVRAVESFLTLNRLVVGEETPLQRRGSGAAGGFVDSFLGHLL